MRVQLLSKQTRARGEGFFPCMCVVHFCHIGRAKKTQQEANTQSVDGTSASVADDDDVAGTGGNYHKGYCVCCVCLSACLPDIFTILQRWL